MFWTLHRNSRGVCTCAKSPYDPKHAAINFHLRARRWLDCYGQVEDFQWLLTSTGRRLPQVFRFENTEED